MQIGVGKLEGGMCINRLGELGKGVGGTHFPCPLYVSWMSTALARPAASIVAPSSSSAWLGKAVISRKASGMSGRDARINLLEQWRGGGV